LPGRSRQADLSKLADAYIDAMYWDTDSYPVWAVDGKRPFGNSAVEYDILSDILEIEFGEDGYDAEQKDYAAELWREVGEYIQAEWAKRVKS
jgi:hypothetical protein